MSGGRPLKRPTVYDRIDALTGRMEMVERRNEMPQETLDMTGCCCFPAPGSRVVPPYKNFSTEGIQPGLPQWQRFAGGLVAARLAPFIADIGVVSFNELAPSRRTEGLNLSEAADYDDADDLWVFRPVDDLGLEPGVIYSIWFSFRITSSGGAPVWALQSRSNNTAPDVDVWGNGGGGGTLAGPSNRHPNAGSTPYNVMDWIQDLNGAVFNPVNIYDATNLPYFGMWPIGGEWVYGDLPLQTGGPGINNGEYGLAFEEGETVRLRAWLQTDSDDAVLYLDHIVAMPTYPAGKSVPLKLGYPDNWQSVAYGAYLYEPDSEPASITNPLDPGWWHPGDTVADDQVIPWPTDPAAHLSVAGHDESDASGLFDGGGSSVHVYVLCRGHYEDPDDYRAGRSGGHVSCFSGSQPIGEILVDEGGGWVWCYAGRMPMGDGPQAAFGMMQWADDGEWFMSQLVAFDEVRTGAIAYVPDAPCEVILVPVEE